MAALRQLSSGNILAEPIDYRNLGEQHHLERRALPGTGAGLEPGAE